MDNNDSLLWQVRAFVYRHFADTAQPPAVDETARHFHISTEEAGNYYRELHNHHAFFLEPETLTVRMAWPFSAVPTIFKVHVNGKTYYANCAWDMLGIPVLLQSDAVLEAICTESNDLVRLEIKNGDFTKAAIPGGEDIALSELRVHYPLPFARWYDDVVFT